MKAEIKEIKDKAFKKFGIEIIVESEDEARLLYHVFNHGCLKEQLKNSDHYGDDYNWDRTANSFSDPDSSNICEYIMSKIFL